MGKEEFRECYVAAVTLKSTSKLGLLVFLTVPIIVLFIQNHGLTITDKSLLSAFFLTALFISFRAWHLFFDAELLKGIANGNFILSDIDKTITALYRKKNQNKTLEIRIESCFKLAKVFICFLALHLILFLSLMFRFLLIY